MNVHSMEGMVPYEAPTEKARHIWICVEGIKPLLTHNPESMNVTPQTKRGSTIPEPEQEAEAGTYRLEDGTCAAKGEAFTKCLIEAGGQWKVPKKRMSMASQLEHISPLSELVPLLRHDGTVIRDYVIDARRAVIKHNGIIRHRPRFDEWRAIFGVEYDPILVPDHTILIQIAQDAGNRKGIGDYRPRFGRFRVISYRIE
jgi:hypothetical protein